jgi:uncharacterized cupredoxin-like copper-binding protein
MIGKQQTNYARKEVFMKKLSVFLCCLFLMALVAALSACGGDSASSASDLTVPQTVHIPMGEMYFKPDITTFKVGQHYKFVLTNQGSITHEFVITNVRKSGQSREDLTNEALYHADQINPGQSMTVDFTFKQPAPAGTLEFECAYPGHYEGGMHAPIVVQ